METSKVLVTGGLGLIGSEIVKIALSNGDEVTCTDDLSLTQVISEEQLLKTLPQDVNFIKIGTDSSKFADALSAKKFDKIFNFGSYSTDRYFEIDPIDAVNKTINGMINVVKLYDTSGAHSLIYPSSGTVYGNSPPPQIENQKLQPQTLYSITKIFLEQYSSILHRNITGVRIFTGFGPREVLKGTYSSVVTLFTMAALKGVPVEIYGDGEQKRDFVSSDDIAKVIYRLSKSQPVVPIVNLGSGKSYSFNDLIKIIEQETGLTINSKYVESKTRFVSETRADTELLKVSCGFLPRSLKDAFPTYLEGLKELISSYKLGSKH
jgi:UDP-glucose 4-epimerase